MLWGKPICCVLLVLFTTLILISSADGASSLVNTNHFSGGFEEVKDGIVSVEMKKRSLLEVNNGKNSSLVLAEERTRRKDPLDDLNDYTGGWNISNKHYFASVIYTASSLFLTAAIWFVVFGLCLLLTCFCLCCCRRRSYGYSRSAYALSVIFLTLFTIATIIGSVVLYTGQGKFHDSIEDTLFYVVRQSDSTVENLRNVSVYLDAAKKVQVGQVSLPSDVKNGIDQVDSKIASAASTLQNETKKNKNNIEDVLEIVRKILIIVAAVMLFLALLGFVFSILGLQFLVSILVILGWILVAVTFILSGVFLVLYNVTGDTCVAMDQWVKNPTEHTALDDLLPCVDPETAQETLSQSKNVTYQLVGVVNGIIANVSNANPPPNAAPLYYNQSGPPVPLLCNPFNANKTDRKCVSGEVELSNATQVLKNYVCQVSSGNNTCITGGRLTPTMYQQMSSAVNVSYGLNIYGPFLSDLMDCTFVRDTFREIERDHCPDLKLFNEWVYIGLTMVASAVALSLILWVLYARERRHRKYTKLADARSLQDSFDSKAQH